MYRRKLILILFVLQIFATAVLASAAAAPSGALLAGPYAHGLLGHAGPLAVAHAAPYAVAHAAPLAVAHAAPLAVAHAIAPAAPTISPGDLQGAAIDAHVDAADHVRAAVDATRELHDQAAEIQGQAYNAAEDHSWQAVDAVKTAEAQLDGAAAGVAPTLAKQLVGHAAPVVAAHGYVAGPAAYAAGGLVAGHAAYAAGGLVAGHAAYAAAPALAASKTVVSQSLTQTHPGAVVAHAAPLAYGTLGLAAQGYATHGLAAQGYAAHGLAAHGYAAHGLSAHGLAHHAW